MANKKRSHPERSKKAKEKKVDQEFVLKCLSGNSTSADTTEEETKKKQHLQEKKESFMDTMGQPVNGYCREGLFTNDGREKWT